MIKPLLTALLAAALPLLACAAPTTIEHLEPAFWWAGMKNGRLQLMVHGAGVAALKPRLAAYPGVRLLGSTAGANPNYLFIDLEIAPNAKPGQFRIDFLQGPTVAAGYDYRLLPREPGSAQRQGFDSRDAIYLIVPDRFANGDPSNDDIAGMGDPANRGDHGGRHGGDITGIAQHLDYIAGMGFTQLWPTPLLENRQPQYSYHGYSPTDLYKIDPRFGSNEDYRRLVEQARAKGLGVIQDIVPNHIGSGHWWMKDLPAPDWINNSGGPYVETNHRHVAQIDAYAAPGDVRRFTEGWFVPTMPDLNQRNPRLATYLIQNAIWWIEYAGLSGLRVDTYPYSDKAFLSRWTRAIRDEYPRLGMVGEEMSNNPLMLSYWLDGARNADGYRGAMPAMMDFPLHGALRDALTEPEGQGYGTGLGKLYEAMVNDALYPEPARMVLFEGNHDTNRIFSALGEDAALNRMAMALIATTLRTPQLFYGSEILLKSPIQRADGEVRADFPGGWAGDAVDAFSGRGLTPAQADAQAYLRKLMNWRKTAKVVHQGRLMHYNPLDGIYVYFRYTASEKLMVVLNKNTAASRLATARFKEMLGDAKAGVDVISGERHPLAESLSVPARSALILEVR
ncbi:glycoside hydrolase family 13 protein [Roseateles violae]|uniref:Glycoside hydrolase family 13 protein n=1 Tax=Roseateles violae TaxID=3058042 RepID=A0ABT8DUG3_9BURK|nr:glycoside hydrolase family 13 protein [Pelomonas sp. PFR6]MDN3921950.1 glycoside hydrolase family 13 protein [Pelomonas sp. PFR6]